MLYFKHPVLIQFYCICICHDAYWLHIRLSSPLWERHKIKSWPHERISFSDHSLCPWDWSARYCTYRRERPSLLDLLPVRFRINFWLDSWGSISPLGDWANALECWRSPSLRLVIPGIAVSPGVTHSDSRIVFVTGTVVKHQPTSWPHTKILC